MRPVLGPDGRPTRQPLGFVAQARVSDPDHEIDRVSHAPGPRGSGFARWLMEGCGMYRYEPYALDDPAFAAETKGRRELSARLMAITLRDFQPRKR